MIKKWELVNRRRSQFRPLPTIPDCVQVGHGLLCQYGTQGIRHRQT